MAAVHWGAGPAEEPFALMSARSRQVPRGGGGVPSPTRRATRLTMRTKAMATDELVSPTMDTPQQGAAFSDLPGAASYGQGKPAPKYPSGGGYKKPGPQYPPQYPPQGGETLVAPEVKGEAAPAYVPPGEEGAAEAGNPTDEVVNYAGTESGEEYIEATPDQLRAESGAESAESDLHNVPGYEAAGESSEEGEVIERPLQEAGEAATGAGQEGAEEEFLPFLAALAPTLISTIGPAVAKGVMGKLSPRARTAVKKVATAAKPVVGAAVKSVAGGGKHQILALIAKLLEANEQKPGGESGEEVDESFVTEAAAALEVIIGTDDRIRIPNTTQIPWRRICALRITFPSGATYRGSGFLIGPRSLATAGHCVYLHNQGGWARRVEVIPGCNGSARPFGQAVSTSFRSVVGWVTNKKPEYDFGCIVLPPGSFGGSNLGSFGFAAFDAAKLLAQPAVLAGYPGDKPFAELWGMARKIKTVTAKTLIYDIDSMGGQSGAPVYIMRNGQRYVVGVHNYGAATGNSATRVTAEVFQRLLGWSKL